MEFRKLMVFVLIILQNSSNTVAEDGEKEATKYNCFSEVNEEKCEDTRVKISDDFYVCDLVVKLDTPPRRIGHVDGDILFSSGGRTFKINNQTLPETVATIIPSGEKYDQNGNFYFDNYGTLFVVEKNSGKEIEIITSEENILNQHVLDIKGKTLFILSFNSGEDQNQKTGELYSISTESLNVENDKVFAKIVSDVGNSITSLAVDTGKALLLGIKEDNRGKLIRLKREQFDPCSQIESTRAAVMNFVKDIGDKILQLIEPSHNRNETHIRMHEQENLRTLTKENLRLQRELNQTNEKLDLISSKWSGFSSHSGANESPIEGGYGLSAPAHKYPSLPSETQYYPQPQAIGGFNGKVDPFVSHLGDDERPAGVSYASSISGYKYPSLPSETQYYPQAQTIGIFNGKADHFESHLGANERPAGVSYAPSISGYKHSSLPSATYNYPQPQTIGGFNCKVDPLVPHFGFGSDSSFHGSHPDNFGVQCACLPKSELDELYLKISELTKKKMNPMFTASELKQDLEYVKNTNA